MLVSRGYDRTTTKAIAEAAGINEVTLFRKYGSKADLFEKAIDHQLSDVPLNQIVFTGDLDADMLQIVEAYIRTNEQHGDIIPTILIEQPRNPELRRALGRPWENITGIVRIIEEYQTRSLLKREPPLAAVAGLIGPLMVIGMLKRANTGIEPPYFDARAHAEAFLHGRRR